MNDHAIEARLDAIEADVAERKSDVAQFAAFFDLIATLIDPQRFSAEVESFSTRAAAAKQAEEGLREERLRLETHMQAARSRLESEGDALIKRVVAAEEEAEQLSGAFARQKKLVRAWTLFGESEEVTSGLMAPRRPAIHKARKAHGLETDWVEDPEVSFDEVRPTMPSIFPSRDRRMERPSRRAR